MCTAATYKTKDFYFGRTLDYEFSYGNTVTVTPRNYPFRFRCMGDMNHHYAIIGMACVMDGCPLYYDAVNEKGLGVAGLNFVGNAHYNSAVDGMDNVAQFEFIPWILAQCENVEQARVLLDKINITDTPFRDDLPVAQLHWLIADRDSAITVESTAQGLTVYDNPVGVLTNNPPFPQQMFSLNNYMSLSPRDPKNRFCEALPLDMYSRGMGAIGLPGDLSSQSRFVRVAFVKMNSVSSDDDTDSISQFFHILGCVDQQRGCDYVEGDKPEITIYTSCCNADRGVYYYTAYNNHQITAVDMHHEDLDGKNLALYPIVDQEQINYLN